MKHQKMSLTPLKQDHKDIPWREMATLRDRIIHGYFSIDYSIVWNVITDELPLLEPKITGLLKELDTMPDEHRSLHTKL